MPILHLPTLATGQTTLDTAFAIAVGDFAGNIGPYRPGSSGEPRPVIRAGLEYPAPWTRDAAFNTWYAGSLLAPEVAKNTLLAVLAETDGELRIDEEYGQYWDVIIWGWGAWNHYLATGDAEFLATALPALENSLRFFRGTEFDADDGLFRGGACFQDGVAGYPDRFVSDSGDSGVLGCLADRPRHAWLAAKGRGLPCKALSTNCLYLLAYQVAGRMRAELRLPGNPEWPAAAGHLRDAINRRFFDEATGSYRYLVDAFDTRDRQEGLGLAFAILSSAAEKEKLPGLVERAYRTRHGIPAVWPRYERYAAGPGVYARHSGTVWPQVNAAWVSGLCDAGFREEALAEVESLAEKAVRDHMFYEIYHPETGLPYGGRQEERGRGIVDWESRVRQTWAATGYIHMVLKTLFGVRFTEAGLFLRPFFPPDVTEMVLAGPRYRGTTLTIRAIRGKSKPRGERFFPTESLSAGTMAITV